MINDVLHCWRHVGTMLGERADHSYNMVQNYNGVVVDLASLSHNFFSQSFIRGTISSSTRFRITRKS